MHKMSELLDKYCERIEKELHDLHTKISKSDTLTVADLDMMDKLLHSLKSDKTVAAMIEYDERDNSDSGYSDGGYSGSRYYNESKRYNTDNGYSGRNRYSRDSERDDMIRKLENMMSRVRTDNEAMVIRDAIDTLSRIG